MYNKNQSINLLNTGCVRVYSMITAITYTLWHLVHCRLARAQKKHVCFQTGWIRPLGSFHVLKAKTFRFPVTGDD
ncbi:hypothetical protein SORBI_3009G011800 [Sorghum bicolor]|uniref:Uncharacterized protein n=2 Tax=Sorghum bicolor TaxID=4558 RepID=A0A1B6P633_SORBI|nr:hypothetical protein SORBI_3009G011800 [Sorghum bicolor]